MSIVVDASVAAKWLLDEPYFERASQLLIENLFAPTLLRLECASAILKRVRLSQLQETGRTRLAEIDHLPIRFFPIDEAAAIELAMTLRHPVYDCVYLALARSHDLQLFTADERFVAAANRGGHGARVRLLAVYTP